MQKANIHACLACGNTEDFHPCLLTLLLDEEDSVVAWAARDYKHVCSATRSKRDFYLGAKQTDDDDDFIYHCKKCKAFI